MTDLRLSIAQSLTSITSLYRDLEAEALHRYADKDYPGGDALLMLGPVANLEAWNYHQLSEIMGRTHRYGKSCEEKDDPAPPLLALSHWADIVAIERGDNRRQRATIDREVAYLRSTLDWITGNNADGEPYFIAATEMNRDLRHLVSRLEAVLHDGIAVDTGVPCMRCGRALVRVYDDGPDVRADRWHCRNCDEWSSVEQYNFAVQAAHRANSDRLNATDMLEEYRIKAGTLTGWAAKGLVRKRGKDRSGRMLYDVEDAVTQRDRGEGHADGEHGDAA